MQWLYNLKTQRKMLILNALLAVNLVWISGAALLRMNNIQGLVKEIYVRQLQAVSALRTLDAEMAQLHGARMMVAMTEDPAQRQQLRVEYDQQAGTVRTAITKAKTALAGTESGGRLNQVAASLETLLTSENSIVDRLAQGDKSAMADSFSINADSDKLQGELASLAAAQEKEAANRYRLSEDTYRGTVWGQVLIMVIGILINVLVAIFIAGLITRPLNQIVESAEALAQGDLSHKVPLESKDEIGAAARALNKAITHLRNLIQQVTRTAEQVASSSEQLAASSSEAGKTTSQVASTIEQLAQGTEEQAKSAQLADETVNQMMQLLKTVTDRLHGTVEDSGTAAERAGTGRDAVGRAVEQMTSISGSVTSSAEVVKGLGERSREIGQIVDVITGIADQTNLLALNAAIEAARAGEQGRGFAVVAEEVRKLAEQSRQAAERISGLIREIQAETGKAVNAMSEGTKEVAAGTSVIDETGQAFQEIASAVETVVSQINEVTDAATKVSTGAEQVVQAVENIANITEQAAASAEEVSAGAEEQTASVQQIAASAEALARVAQELQGEVAKFKL